MQVKTYTGTSTKEIMARIKEELGPEAIILSSQKTARGGVRGYEIMAALDNELETEEPVSTDRVLREDGELAFLREEWGQLRKQLMAVLRPRMDLGVLSPRQQVVMDYLEREGVRQEVLFSLWEEFRRRRDEPTLSILSDLISVHPWLGTSWPNAVHFFAGPHGSGKTSTVLRLALAMKKSRPEARVLVLNADRSQGKGRLYLRHYTELSGLSYRELDTVEQWIGLERECSRYDAVLVDLPGLGGRETLHAWLHEASGGNVPVGHTHLVLSPLFSPGQMDCYVSRLGQAAASIIWTKLDEACNFGEILNQSVRTGLPVSLLSVGPELKHTLVQPRNQDVWKLLLRHELPETLI